MSQKNTTVSWLPSIYSKYYFIIIKIVFIHWKTCWLQQMKIPFCRCNTFLVLHLFHRQTVVSMYSTAAVQVIVFIVTSTAHFMLPVHYSTLQ